MPKRLLTGFWMALSLVHAVLPANAQTRPVVTIAATDAAAAEQNRDPAQFRISRSGGTNLTLSVRYQFSGTAAAGRDYANLSGTAVIPSGQTSTTIPLLPIDDTLIEGNESVTLSLLANSAYALGNPGQATATIADNDGPLPVLIVIPNNDFYYTEYAAPRRELEAARIRVVVGAGRRVMSTPHANTGQPAGSNGAVMPDIDLASARATNYSAIVFVGGYGATQYQFAFPGTYANASYNATPEIRNQANRLVNEFTEQNKYVTGICLGVSDLAWARVNGVSPVRGRRVVIARFTTPPNTQGNNLQYRWHPETNGAAAVFDGGAYGDPNTYNDDVIVDGRIITASNYDSAPLFGRTLANRILGR